MAGFYRWKLLIQFEKWRATCASMVDVGSVLVWVVY